MNPVSFHLVALIVAALTEPVLAQEPVRAVADPEALFVDEDPALNAAHEPRGGRAGR